VGINLSLLLGQELLMMSNAMQRSVVLESLEIGISDKMRMDGWMMGNKEQRTLDHLEPNFGNKRPVLSRWMGKCGHGSMSVILGGE
jgi:hypothetical protein